MIYGLADWQFWLNGFYFIFLATVLFFVPGWWLLNLIRVNQKISRATKLFLCPVLGLSIFTLLIWLGGTLGFYQILYVYLVAAFGLTVYYGIKKWRTGWRFSLSKKNLLPLFLLIIFGLGLQMPAIFTSGLRSSEGVRFFFTNNQDGLMHLGFINALAEDFPPLRPEVNDYLYDYHYFSDLLMAQFVRLGVPAINVFCQYLPIFISIFTTGLVYQAVFFVTKKRSAAVLTTLVFLLAGDGGWLLNIFLQGGNGWAMASFDNGADQFLNMPFAVAKLIFVAAWLSLNYFWQSKNQKALFLLPLLLIPLTLFKVYWLFFFIGGWGITLAVRWFQTWRKKQIGSLLIKESLIAGVVLFCSWFLLQSIVTTGDSLHFIPQVWPREIAAAHHLNWQNWFLREQVFLEAQNQPRLILENAKLLLAALIFVFGVRLFGLLPNKKARSLLHSENIWFFYPSFFVWTFFGFNFLQEKGGFNTFNFLILAATALSFLLGVKLAVWWDSKKPAYLGKLAVVVIFLLLAPRTFYNWWNYVQTTAAPDFTVGLYETDFLELLLQAKKSTRYGDLFVVAPKNERFTQASVIPGLIGRKTYLSNQFILETHNYDFSAQAEKLKTIWQENDPIAWQEQLRDLGAVAVILETSDLESLTPPVRENLQPSFSNKAGMLILLDSEL
ncbi:MAG: hypothetical protein Q4G02_01880 [bacterium]|nr:hypothetical protein [bacterium]